MRNVVFVAPYWLPTTRRFAEAVSRLADVRLLGICHFKPEGLAPGEISGFSHIVQVENCFDADELEGAVRGFVDRYGPVHRLIGVLEHMQATLGEVRDRLGLPGLGREAAVRFTDKNVMKEALRAAGLPCARHALVTSDDEARRFAADVGFPVVMKPPRGAGCKSTYQIGDPAQLAAALREMRPSPARAIQAEEFIQGEEFSFDTVAIGGEVMLHSISRYLPGPLDVMRHEWIQWKCILPRRIDGPEFDAIRGVGAETVRRLGMQSGITHMEWFRRPDGSVAIGEIAARPPGAQITPMIGHAHGVDMYRVWARAVVDEAFDGPFERQWAVGCAFLRGVGNGRIVRVDGIDEAQRRMGHLVVDAKLPTAGAPKFDGYEGDGWAIVRARETEHVVEALRLLTETVRVHYA